MSAMRVSLRWLAAAALVPVLVLSLGTPASGQNDWETAPAAEDEGDPLSELDEIFEDEDDLLAGGGYDPGGRRDPFLSLLVRTQLRELPEQRPEGVPGLLIDELDVKGIFELNRRMFAQVQTTDRSRSYLIQEGDHLFDGEVVSIAANEVAFKQIVNDPSIIKPFREVVKRLNPES